MIFYHPAFDSYHSAFRMLRILEVLELEDIEYEMLRIYDFYYLFPHLLSGMRLRREDMKWKKNFKSLENPYHFTGLPKSVFERMELYQRLAVIILASNGYLHPFDYNSDIELKRTSKILPDDYLSIIKTINDSENGIFDFFRNVLANFQLLGPDGIKARCGLMEFKYDNV